VVPTPARFAALLDRYEGFLFDAYGVLVDAGGVAPGAAAALAALSAAGKPFAVVTNDASRLPTTAAARFARVGLPIAAEQVVSSGLMLGPAVAAAGLAGARAIVLGTADARAYAADAGLEVVATADDAAIDALVICDDAGFDFLAGMNAALTACVRALDGGRPLGLIVANPDLVFPRGGGRLGFTAGTMAAMIEAVLARRYATPPRFVAVGQAGAGDLRRGPAAPGRDRTGGDDRRSARDRHRGGAGGRARRGADRGRVGVAAGGGGGRGGAAVDLAGAVTGRERDHGAARKFQVFTTTASASRAARKAAQAGVPWAAARVARSAVRTVIARSHLAALSSAGTATATATWGPPSARARAMVASRRASAVPG
jgi:ribonucleotide monophosphatase NagD (HAD superfamily)